MNAGALAIYVSTVMASSLRDAANFDPMDHKDSFMRFVVIGAVVAVGVLALVISMNS